MEFRESRHRKLSAKQKLQAASILVVFVSFLILTLVKVVLLFGEWSK